MNNKLHIVIAAAVGLIIGGLVLFQAYVVYQDHENLSSVVNYLNSVIASQQRQQEVSVPASK